jgi:hypothetical protein
MKKYIKVVSNLIAVYWMLQMGQYTAVASQTNSDSQETLETDLFDPSEKTEFVGRLFSSSDSYPLMRMKKLCEPYTGIDTAQIQCEKVRDGFMCNYKCSLHWHVQ